MINKAAINLLATLTRDRVLERGHRVRGRMICTLDTLHQYNLGNRMGSLLPAASVSSSQWLLSLYRSEHKNVKLRHRPHDHCATPVLYSLAGSSPEKPIILYARNAQSPPAP